MSTVPHPTSRAIPPEDVQRDFFNLTFNHLPDPLWHFQLAVPRTTLRVPDDNQVPQPNGPLVSLVLLNRPDPICDIEVLGQFLPFELDPADWLDAWLEQQNFTVLSKKRIPMLAGAAGDVIARMDVNGTPGISRLFALKAGPRLILLWFRTPEASYASIADAIFTSISNFQMLDDSPGPLGERVVFIEKNSPARWRLAMPASWGIQDEPEGEKVSSFQASLFEAAPDGTPILLGKFSLAMISPDLATSAAQVFENLQAVLMDGGVSARLTTITPEQAGSAYLGEWSCVAPATVEGRPVEVHCRVMQHALAWVAVMVVHPAREHNPWMWMRAKRLLDIATATLEFLP